MKTYILRKDLPDADAGTRLIWDEPSNAYYYRKGAYTSPHDKNFLTAGQVTQTPEWFSEEVQEPPIGIIPKYLHNERRLRELNEAIKRYEDAKLEIPEEWTMERVELEASVAFRTLKGMIKEFIKK